MLRRAPAAAYVRTWAAFIGQQIPENAEEFHRVPRWTGRRELRISWGSSTAGNATKRIMSPLL
jgi:hypothetical protein